MQTPKPTLPAYAAIAPSKRSSSGRSRKLIAVFFCAAVLPALTARAGNISGVVRDASSGMPLPGAFVRVEGTNIITSADEDGSYRIVDLPAGPVNLRAESMQFQSTVRSVTVTATGEVSADILLPSDVVKMEQMVVEGYREGRSLALQQKRGATNIIDVISADSVGNMPDRNAAEALSRVAGVSLTNNEGEGQYVSIRGIEPNLNQVLVDGATMAAPGGTRTGRAVPLDVMSASQISQIQVIKSVTPDLDANSLGGTINIKTISAFDRQGSFALAKVKIDYNDLREKFGYGGEATYGTTFAGNKIGIAMSASYDKRYTQNDYEQSNAWKPITDKDARYNIWLPTGYELYSRPGERELYGLTFNMEVRIDPTTIFYIKPNYTHATRVQQEDSMLYTLDESRVILTSPTTGNYPSRSRVEFRSNRYKQEEDLFNVSVGMKKTLGRLTIEPMVNFSKSNEKRPYHDELRFRSDRDVPDPISFDFTSFGDWTLISGTNEGNAAKYPMRMAIHNTKDVDEEIYSGKLDVRWDDDKLVFGVPGYIKGGIKYIDRDRSQEIPSERFVPKGSWTLADIGVDKPGKSFMDGLYQGALSSTLLI